MEKNEQAGSQAVASPDLFSPDAVYVAAGGLGSRERVLSDIAADLQRQGLVTEGFLPNLLERERVYPTGMDMSVVGPALPNFAVPHTEPEFVRATRVVPVRLLEPVEWGNMLFPDRTLPVSFLFMILNDSPEAQVGLLARIMDFVNGLGAEAPAFFALDDPARIHSFLVERFPA